jgi:protein-S-isoprenylcysteine O-methyltransferase Ste14
MEGGKAPEVTTARIVIGIVIGFIVTVGMLFGSAGTVNWVEGWLYVILQFSFSTALAVWLKKNNPALLKDRMIFLKKSAKNWDKAIVLMAAVLFVPLFVLPGLDAIRYQWSRISLPLKMAGFAGTLVSFGLVFWVMRENTYLSRVVEIQRERGHKVIITGPYQYVRHPMYVGVIVWIFCIPLALGSCFTFIPAAILTSLILLRTFLEDKTLHKELEGYEAYAQKVRYRLLPGVWQVLFEAGEQCVSAIVLRDTGELVGAMGLEIVRWFERAKVGFWIGIPYWSRGYCTEAGRAVLEYGFIVLVLKPIHASHFTRNPASGLVLQELGMKHEGYARQHVKKWEKFEGLKLYRILKEEWKVL